MLELPGYEIVREIGRGGMARVYLARHEGLDRDVAIKVMFPNLASDSSYSERFIREARIVAKLSHHNIVTVYDVGIHENYHYIAMEFLPGVTLDDKLKDGMDSQQIMHIVKQVSAGLAYAHDKGFIHRDIKPENILFREDGTAVISDFGIARATKSETKMTAVGTVIGTAHYMSPEQAQGKELTPSSDIYSIGIMMYEMFTGEVPYDADSTIAIVFKHIDAPIPDLPDGKEKFQPILEKLMAKQPEDRYQTCNDIINDIVNLERGNSPSRATELFSAEDLGLAGKSNKQTQFVKMPKKASNKPWGLIIGSLVGLSVLGAAGYGYVTFYLPQQEQAEVQRQIEEEKREKEKVASELRLKDEQLKYQRQIEKERKLRDEQLAKLQEEARIQKAESDRKFALAEKRAAAEKKKRLERELAAKRKAEQQKTLQAKRQQEQIEFEAAERANQVAKQEQIKDLLAAANTSYKNKQLKTAYKKYNAVLSLEPLHLKAQKGIKAVADTYLSQAKTYADNNQFTSANQNVAEVINFMPENSNVRSTQTYILKKKKAYQQELLLKQQKQLEAEIVTAPEPSPEPDLKTESKPAIEEAPRRRSFGGF